MSAGYFIERRGLNGYGQTALVTGASRGIGREIAKRLAALGAHVIAHYGASVEAAEELAHEVRAAGGRLDLIAADLAAPDAPWAVMNAISALGIDRLDILISNAGVSGITPVEQQTVETFERYYAINVRTPYFLIQQALLRMRDGGRIVVVTSSTARKAPIGASLYASTKGAANVLVRCLAAELGPRGIRVNGLAPGVIETDMMANAVNSPEGRRRILGQQAFQRIGQPDDIADAALFLVSHQSRWITGRILEVDGGTHL